MFSYNTNMFQLQGNLLRDYEHAQHKYSTSVMNAFNELKKQCDYRQKSSALTSEIKRLKQDREQLYVGRKAFQDVQRREALREQIKDTRREVKKLEDMAQIKPRLLCFNLKSTKESMFSKEEYTHFKRYQDLVTIL